MLCLKHLAPQNIPAGIRPLKLQLYIENLLEDGDITAEDPQFNEDGTQALMTFTSPLKGQWGKACHFVCGPPNYRMAVYTRAVLVCANSLVISSIIFKLKSEIVHNIDLQSQK